LREAINYGKFYNYDNGDAIICILAIWGEYEINTDLLKRLDISKDSNTKRKRRAIANSLKNMSWKVTDTYLMNITHQDNAEEEAAKNSLWDTLMSRINV